MLSHQIEHNLLHVNDLDVPFLEQMVRNLLARRVDFCDLYLQNTAMQSYTLDEQIIKSGTFSIDQGIGIRAVCGDKSFLSYSNSLNPNVIKQLVNNIFVEPNLHIDVPQQAHESYNLHNLYTANNPILTPNTDKINILQRINILGRQYSHVTNVVATLSLEYDEVYIINNRLNPQSDIRPLIHLSITVIVSKQGKNETGSSGTGGRVTLTILTDDVLVSHVKQAYNQAMLKLDAVAGPKGHIPVVLGNAWAGVILHEAIGHGLEGDFNRKGSSAFTNCIGQQVASKGVTIVDDGCMPNRRGSLNIDDEGNPTQKNVLIEDGILKGYLFDELNAKLMNTKSTGNGRRESFNACPMPRMTNTYMQNGSYTPEEIIASVEHGIYAENFSGGQVDITSGQFVFNANVAWVIQKGKLSYPVKGCALVGSGPECLKYISMIGNNFALDDGVGTCGKNGQSVPVGVGQPTIKIDGGLVVGGE